MTTSSISPGIFRESSAGITLVSIYDEMLTSRELSLVGEVEQRGAFDLCCHLRRLERCDPRAEIVLYISSPGGSVSAGLAVYDTIRGISCPVRTVCVDTAASMGAVIFAAGDRREMLPHAELMIHDPLIPTGAGGSALSVQETSRRLMSTRKRLNTILAERSGLTLRRVQQLTSRDTWLDADRAIELGFAHAVTPSAKEN